MTRYRKRPVEIEAVQFCFLDADKAHKAEFDGPPPEWLKNAMRKKEGEPGAVGVVKDMASVKRRLIIETLECPLTVSNGDFIIQGVKGELYPCKPDIFAVTYEPVETQ